MPCNNSSLCLTIDNSSYSHIFSENNETWMTNSSIFLMTESISGTRAWDAESRRQLHAMFTDGTTTAVLSVCVLVFMCSTVVLLGTHWIHRYHNVTFVFLRSMYVSDILMSLYGTFKMTMLMFIEQLNINFFLPESLFFTAAMASTMSLIFLNVDCFLKLARPHQYKQVDGDTVITAMVLMWNVAFILGFLPLIGWNLEANTVRFFRFYPWHYLFFNGCMACVCLAVCVGCIVSVRRFHTLPRLDFNCFSTRTSEIQNYTYFHGTIILESVLWLCCYLPFFIYIALTCSQCLLSDFTNRDFSIIYFIPLFMVKSLLSSLLHVARTFQAQVVTSNRFSGTTILKHLTRALRMNHTKQGDDVAISYINPLCEYNNFRSHGDIEIIMDQNRPILYPSNRVMKFEELIHDSGFYFGSEDSRSSLAGITNNSYRASISSRRGNNASEETTTTL